ncbi:dnaJ homolog subfamily B member 14 isoform X4 [Falco peregrinus]|uniref:dnaJ homolog subfamily B member 14 isoform X4 n=2 Tax=Falco TaxID=8952 RepID=UPI002479E699|nr:dnaJ homolog subfamily B member 14 isoform X4 [Falco peregrinus]
MRGGAPEAGGGPGWLPEPSAALGLRYRRRGATRRDEPCGVRGASARPLSPLSSLPGSALASGPFSLRCGGRRRRKEKPMEGNRDEAEKCIGIAREALEAGNRDRALRFLGKAQKLYPTETARVLLEAIMKNGSTAGGGTYCRKPASSSNDQSKPNSTKESNASCAGESGKGYTKDQMEGVLSLC